MVRKRDLHPLGQFEATLDEPVRLCFAHPDGNRLIEEPSYIYVLRTEHGRVNMIFKISPISKDFLLSNQVSELKPGISKIKIDIHHKMGLGDVPVSYPRHIGHFYE